MQPNAPVVETIENDAELQDVIDLVIASSGINRDELKKQAEDGNFNSEKARMACFVISALDG